MKKRVLNSLLILAVAMGMAPSTAREARAYGGTSVSISVSYFYDTLEPYGRWVDYESYGRCWVPENVGAGWRPYSDGYWVYTDFGWTWVDYEPWGWAVSHYGRWLFDADYGWVWVPGTVWGPAWVAWRECDDYVGWAPLPPYGSWQTISISYSSRSLDRVRSRDWCFVPTRNLLDRRLSFAPRERNGWLLGRSRDVTRFSVRDGRPVNRGLDLGVFERRSGHRVNPLRTVNADSPRSGMGQRRGGNDIAFFRPNLRRGMSLTPRPESRVSRGGRSNPLQGRNEVARQERGRFRPTERRQLDRPSRPERTPQERPVLRPERQRGNDGRPEFQRNPLLERGRNRPEPSRDESFRRGPMRERPNVEPRPIERRERGPEFGNRRGGGEPPAVRRPAPEPAARERRERPQPDQEQPAPREESRGNGNGNGKGRGHGHHD